MLRAAVRDNMRVGGIVGVSGRARAEHKKREGQILCVLPRAGHPAADRYAAEPRLGVLLALTIMICRRRRA